MASDEMLAEKALPAEGVLHPSIEERAQRATLFAAMACTIGVLSLLAGQLGWWAVLAGPAYVAGTAVVTMLARGRAQALLAVALASGSMVTLVGLVKLTGLA